MKLEGRRIVEIQYFFQKLKELANHSPQFGCTFNNLNIIKEKRTGLQSEIHIVCNMCNSKFLLNTNDPSPANEKMDINIAAVSGIMTIGSVFFLI